MTATAQIIPFAYDSHLIRTVTIDGAIWFVAKDVCNVLRITWNGRNTLNAIPDGWRGVWKLHTPSSDVDGRGGGEQEFVIINEAAVYKLAFRSNKPEADRFTNWVASDVLPSIRKTGGYHVHQSSNDSLSIDDEPLNVINMRLSLVKEARLLFGAANARAFWKRIGLPVISDEASKHHEDAASVDPHECLNLILDTDGMRSLIEQVLSHDTRHQIPLLEKRGLRLHRLKSGKCGFVVAGNHPAVLKIVKGTAFEGYVNPTLLTLKEAQSANVRFNGKAMRCVFVPEVYLDHK